MPTYTYECKHCKSIEDITHTVKQCDWKWRCIKCGQDMVRRINASPIQLKGSCWSRDGYTHPNDYLNKC